MNNNIEEYRAEIFNILSALFCQPEGFVAEAKLYESLIQAYSKACPKGLPHAERLKNSVKQYSLEELLIEYARLFVGPFGMTAAPYSSLYFEEKVLMSNVTIWVLEYYKSCGLHFDRNTKDLPDHVAVETEFLYSLIFQKLKEQQNGNTEMAEKIEKMFYYFFNNHYAVWVPKFCKAISDGTTNDFYRSLAGCLTELVESMKEN